MPVPKLTLWQRTHNSWTIWLGAIVTTVGGTLDVLNLTLPILASEDAQQALKTLAGPYTSTILQVVGIATIACRMRSIVKDAK